MMFQCSTHNGGRKVSFDSWSSSPSTPSSSLQLLITYIQEQLSSLSIATKKAISRVCRLYRPCCLSKHRSTVAAVASQHADDGNHQQVCLRQWVKNLNIYHIYVALCKQVHTCVAASAAAHTDCPKNDAPVGLCGPAGCIIIIRCSNSTVIRQQCPIDRCVLCKSVSLTVGVRKRGKVYCLHSTMRKINLQKSIGDAYTYQSGHCQVNHGNVWMLALRNKVHNIYPTQICFVSFLISHYAHSK